MNGHDGDGLVLNSSVAAAFGINIESDSQNQFVVHLKRVRTETFSLCFCPFAETIWKRWNQILRNGVVVFRFCQQFEPSCQSFVRHKVVIIEFLLRFHK